MSSETHTGFGMSVSQQSDHRQDMGASGRLEAGEIELDLVARVIILAIYHDFNICRLTDS